MNGLLLFLADNDIELSAMEVEILDRDSQVGWIESDGSVELYAVMRVRLALLNLRTEFQNQVTQIINPAQSQQGLAEAITYANSGLRVLDAIALDIAAEAARMAAFQSDEPAEIGPDLDHGLPTKFVDFCMDNGLTPPQVVAAFIGDLVGIEGHDEFRSGGSDERAAAHSWFARRDWSFMRATTQRAIEAARAEAETEDANDNDTANGRATHQSR